MSRYTLLAPAIKPKYDHCKIGDQDVSIFAVGNLETFGSAANFDDEPAYANKLGITPLAAEPLTVAIRLNSE